MDALDRLWRPSINSFTYSDDHLSRQSGLCPSREQSRTSMWGYKWTFAAVLKWLRMWEGLLLIIPFIVQYTLKGSPFERFPIWKVPHLKGSPFERFPIWKVPHLKGSPFERFPIWKVPHFENHAQVHVTQIKLKINIEINSIAPGSTARVQPLRGRGQDHQHFYWPQTLDSFLHGGRFSSITLQWSGWFQDLPFFQLYTRLNDLKFKITKKFWGQAHQAPSPDPSPAPRASPLIWASPQISDALRLRFRLRLIRTPNFWSMIAPLVHSRKQ